MTPDPWPLLWGELTDVPGVLVGHAERIGGGRLTGVTVVLPPPGTVGSVDVRGGGPGTHEIDALDPTTLVPTVDAVTLTGGSAFGLVAAHGVQRWCAEHGRGFAAGPPSDPTSLRVPIVPAAAIFDLGRGGAGADPAAQPDAELGRLAVLDAAASTGRAVPRGNVGAGAGALIALQTLKGGVGTASVTLPGGLVVGAVVVANALGSPVDPVTGALLGTAFIPPGRPRPMLSGDPLPASMAPTEPGPANTTLAVVVTNAALDPAQARRTATAAHDGIGRALSPAHTLFDGDTVFALATGQIPVDLPTLVAVQAAAADAVLLAILDAVLSTPGLATDHPAGITVPSYRDHYPTIVG
ncbi:MAG TPA: P1 family peptidase [Kineosporiaceae bacterium]|nr:P1 family peptidase [Kineosporiaceae bacterium]